MLLSSSLKKLILLRHGTYDPLTGYLTPEGQEQNKRLATRIQPLINSAECVLFCSEKERSKESANILKEQLNLKKIHAESLFYMLNNEHEFKESLLLLNSYELEQIIVTSHFDFLPNFCFYLHNSFNFIPADFMPDTGQGLLIDFKKEEVTFL